MLRKDIKRRPLADTVLATLEPEAKEYREADNGGLYFRVKPDGSKSWQFRYKKSDGKWSWIGLGGYPAVSGMRARELASESRSDAASGQNPLTTKKSRKDAQLSASKSTFESLAREWHSNKAKGWTEGTTKRTLGALELHVFPAFGSRPFADILPFEWMQLLRTMEQKGIIEQTSRIRSICGEIYDLARVTGRATHNPLDGLNRFLQKSPAQNYSHVPPEELPALLRAIRSYPTRDISIGMQLLCMIACRPSEIRCARWSEFDFKNAMWTIPAERMKRRRSHVIPLPTQAIELLHELKLLKGHQPLLFPGRNDQTKPRSDTVFLMALRRLGYGATQTGHGFRHIASTTLNEQGFDENWIEAQLSHVKGGVAGVYNKALYLPQRAAMMQWYADHLHKLAREVI